MATASYTFSTGVPSIVPAVYAVGTTTPNLNSGNTATNSAGVLTLTLDIGDYYAQWRWEGDTHQTGGEVSAPDTLGEVSARASSGASVTSTGTTIGTSSIVDGTIVVTYTSVWGIDSNGDPYYDAAGAVSAEAAILTVDPTTGDVVVVRPTGANA